jgi:DNA replication protein DnaC
LRLGGLLAHWDQYLKTAGEKRWSHTALLTHVLQEEYALKRENARKLRLRAARIPELLVLETFPFERQPKLNKKKLMAVYDSFNYIQQAQNILWLGGTGPVTQYAYCRFASSCEGKFQIVEGVIRHKEHACLLQ